MLNGGRRNWWRDGGKRHVTIALMTQQNIVRSTTGILPHVEWWKTEMERQTLKYAKEYAQEMCSADRMNCQCVWI